MAHEDRTRTIPGRTPQSAAMLADVKRAMAITARLNRLTFDDAEEVRALFSVAPSLGVILQGHPRSSRTCSSK